ncbi:MAG: VOC family protein [Planctomycetales bacterium]|nr:VOC family protein [Planctomycetales bacterium]
MGHPVCHLEIAVTDLERAKRFYSDLFGWTFRDWVGAPMGYSLFSTGQEWFGGGLMKVDAPRPPGGLSYYVEVDDVDAFVARATAAGGRVVQPNQQIDPEVGWSALVTDPDGNLVGLYKAAHPRPVPEASVGAPQGRKSPARKAPAPKRGKAVRAKKGARGRRRR